MSYTFENVPTDPRSGWVGWSSAGGGAWGGGGVELLRRDGVQIEDRFPDKGITCDV